MFCIFNPVVSHYLKSAPLLIDHARLLIDPARLLIDHERLVDGRVAAARLDVRSQPAVVVTVLRGLWNGDAELGSLRTFVDNCRRFVDRSPGRGLLSHCHCHPVYGLVVLHDRLFGVRLEIELL